MIRAALIALLPALLLTSGCRGKTDDDSAGPAGELSGCDPVDPALCALPYPSGYFQVDDAGEGSGKRNAYGPTALPINRDDVPLQPDLLNERDGYSTLTPLVTFFDDVSLDGTLTQDTLGDYTAADAKTVLLNAATGERVPHFVELDMTAEEPGERLLILRPVAPMDHGARYVVGIRGLTTNAGGPVAVSPAFAGLRDGDDKAHPDVPLLRDRYENGIFDVLEADGFPRADLQLAWEFTTVSRENLHKDVLHMRDDALASLPADGPEYTIDSVETGDCAGGDTIHTTIEGTVTLNRYLDTDAPGSVIVRGADGLPAVQGETHPNFLIRIPCSLAENPRQAPLILHYGHGLLGSRGEARTGWLSAMANEHSFVVFAMDWNGMAEPDVGGITIMLASDVSDFRMIPERSEHGLIEKVVGLRMMQTSIVDDPALEFGGVPILEGAPLGYYGNSQGGILGAAYLAVSPDLERGVLGVPGMPYSTLLSRSVDFDPFFLIFQQKYLDHREITLILMVMQTLWDPGEPSGFAEAVNEVPLPNTPPKDVLLQVGIGDAQVTPLGAHVMARAFGAKTVAPQTRPIWGVDEAQPGFTGSAIVEFGYSDVPEAPKTNVPPNGETDTHECPRREPAGQQQIADFLLTGAVTQHCDGPCIGLREGLCD